MCLSLCVYFQCARVCTCVQQPVEDGVLHLQRSILIPQAFSNLERNSEDFASLIRFSHVSSFPLWLLW